MSDRRAGIRSLRLLVLGALGAVGSGGCGETETVRASLSVSETLAATDTAGYARADRPRQFAFPADHGPHPDFKHEWWYFTGNLEADDGRPFGFQLTIFRSALRPDSAAIDSEWSTRQAYMGHFALSDIAAERFHAFERFDRGALGLAGAEGEPMRVWVGDWEAVAMERGDGTPAASAGVDPGSLPAFRIRAAESGVGLDLVLEAVRPLVLQGDSGLSQKGPEPGNASYYYSLTRLQANGTVTVNRRATPVRGLAWLDREWSTSALSPGIAGWDWFSIQLDDGSDLMVYRLRQDDGGTAPFSAGSFVAPDGTITRLEADDFALEQTGSWSSPRGGTYPSGWVLRLPHLDLALSVTPRFAAQELDLAFRYWEGAVAVDGERAGQPVSGRGYVELTGYAEAPRP